MKYKKTLEAMHNICDRVVVKFLHFLRDDASEKYWDHVPDESRCLKHHGPKSQGLIAQYAKDIFLS
jgi:hypothetical protein